MRADKYAAPRQDLLGDAAGDAQRRRQAAGKMPPAAHIRLPAPFHPRGIIGVRGARLVGQLRVVRGVLVAVVNDRAQRRAAGHAVAQTGEEFRRVGFLPRGRKRAFSGFAPIQKGLQLRKINALARRQAVDGHADRGSVGLSEHADAQRSSEFRGHRSYLPVVCIPPRRRDRISAPPPRL